MKKNELILFIIFLLVFGGAVYWYVRGNICERGISYHIGSIDNSYDLSEAQLVSIIDEAADIWEEEIGYSVFSYELDSDDVEVNLIFDERQQLTLEERDARNTLETSKQSIESIQTTLQRDSDAITLARKQFDALQQRYDSEKRAFNQLRGDAAAYNSQVSRVNALVQELQSRQAQLNRMVESYNARVTQAGEQVDAFNNTVGAYNNNYVGEGEAFDKGDYGGGVLNLYQYESREDLVLLVAHELGHVLGIDHVENAQSVMFYSLVGQDTKSISLTEQDKAALTGVCSS